MLALPLFLGAIAMRMLTCTIVRADDDPWLVGDWLINYAGGMVRRSLTGMAAAWTGVLQLLSLTALLVGLYRLARPPPLTLPLVVLLASPALLLLYIHNPHGGFRKEVLLHRGDAAQVAAICAWWAAQAPRDCQGQDPLLWAISFLAVDTRTAMAYAVKHTPPSAVICYAVATLLFCVPLAVVVTFSNAVDFPRRRRPRGLVWLLATVVARVTVLNAVAADHGRLLHILITGLSLLLLLAMNAQGERLRFRRSPGRPITVLLAVLSVFGWELKYFQMTPVKLFW
ncbi:MAG: hypothetical protein C0434_05275 [Xanthomonadaceae bacterium]|nr:hypothetical protein [Xanthomonadaceae bacterium]